MRVLRLQPRPCPAADVARADPLRDDAFKAHAAGVPKDGRAVAGERLAELDAVAHGLVAAREQPRQALRLTFVIAGYGYPVLVIASSRYWGIANDYRARSCDRTWCSNHRLGQRDVRDHGRLRHGARRA